MVSHADRGERTRIISARLATRRERRLDEEGSGHGTARG
ncbi:BrnT family toxin [Tautonia rosea]